MTEIVKPELKEGEVYAGAIINPDGTGNHIILFGEDFKPDTWDNQMAKSALIGYDLPNRVESALLFNQSKDQFERDLYWTNETHVNDTEWAWFQNFYYGGQYNDGKGSKLRARAVRRLAI
ncbi:MAG: hypothetical protein WBP13_00700 [Methylophilaceae bacterium]